MPMVVVARERVVGAPGEMVWRIVADPARWPVLDPKASLVSVTGELGTAGSGYVLQVRGRWRTVRAEHVVTEAEPGVRLITEERRGDRVVSVAEIRLSEVADGATKVIRIVRASGAPGLAWLVAYLARLELGEWVQRLADAAENQPAGAEPRAAGLADAASDAEADAEADAGAEAGAEAGAGAEAT